MKTDRPNFFSGRLLTATDLQQEQEYHKRGDRGTGQAAASGDLFVRAEGQGFSALMADRSAIERPNVEVLVSAALEKGLGLAPLTPERRASLEAAAGEVAHAPGVPETVEAGRAWLETGDEGARAGLATGLGGILDQPKGDILATLFFVFKESVVEQAEDKKYWMAKLQQMHSLAEAMGDALDAASEPPGERDLAAAQPESANRTAEQGLSLLSSILESLVESRTGVVRDPP